MSARARVAWAVAISVVIGAAWALLRDPIDIVVYQLGTRAWWSGADVYSGAFDTGDGFLLPFTYPPTAALLFAPLVPIGIDVAEFLVVAGSVFVLMAIVARLRVPPVPVAAAIAVALLMEPVRATLGFGQINILLMAMVMADLLIANPRWPRGMLLGVAIALKLTPAVFALVLLVRRDWRALITTGATFLALSLLAFALRPSATVDYWTDVLWRTDRIGGAAYAGNQSWTGMLARLMDPGPARTLTYLALSAATLAVLLAALRRLGWAGPRDRGALLSVVAVGLAGLLWSPVSWTHHWVWCVPLVAGLWAVHRAWALVGLAVFLVGWPMLLPKADDVELAWQPWQHVVGNAYVLFAVAVLVLLAVSRRPVPPVASARAARGADPVTLEP